MSESLITECLCGAGEEFFVKAEKNKVPILHCTKCGVIVQNVPMQREQYSDYYSRGVYHGRDRAERGLSTYASRYAHDREVAHTRQLAYKIPKDSVVLDFGSSNNAFVDEMRSQGVETYGVDLNAEFGGEYTYYEDLLGIGFPTENFDFITIHDVLEHCPNPRSILKEMYRILNEKGSLIIDFPNFFVKEGTHHWKIKEHLWFLTEDNLRSLLNECGFTVSKTDYPIKSKFVFYCRKKKEERVSILVPPGIGDSYWSICKLESFCKVNKLGIPNVFISQLPGAPQRSHDFLKRIPFIRYAGYLNHQLCNEFHEAYMEDKRCIFRNVVGCDYFIAFNGRMRYSKSLEECHPEYDTNWYPKLFYPLEERRYGESFLKNTGDYLVTYFVPHGMYQDYLKLMDRDALYEMLVKLSEVTGYKIVIIGAEWDKDTLNSYFMGKGGPFIDMVGKTDFTQMSGILRNAKGVVGYPAGNTILAAVLKIPTVLLWSNYFDQWDKRQRFPLYACPPDSLGNWYHAMRIDRCDTRDIVAAMLDLLRKRVVRDERLRAR